MESACSSISASLNMFALEKKIKIIIFLLKSIKSKCKHAKNILKKVKIKGRNKLYLNRELFF